MIRPALTLILLFLAVVMMRGVASDWRKSISEPSGIAAQKSAPGSDALSPGVPAPPLQPATSPNLPDLKVGYVFNQERMLGGNEPLPEDKGDELGADNENAQGITADIEDITFVGSIITDAFSRALIVYPAQNLSGPAKPTSRSSRVKVPTQRAGGGAEEHAQLEVGDKISGYEVTEILFDKLIFAKGDEKVEKLLFDPAKTRQAPPPRPGSGAVGGGPPRPASPGGILSTTIGGGTVGGGGMVPAGVAGSSGRQTLPPPPPQAVNSPTSSRASSNSGAVRSAPVRRMVISRQSSPAPDTSKVVRQSRDSDQAVPMPPGIEAGGGSIEVNTPSGGSSIGGNTQSDGGDAGLSSPGINTRTIEMPPTP